MRRQFAPIAKAAALGAPAALTALAALVTLAALGACGEVNAPTLGNMPSGLSNAPARPDPARGRQLLLQYQCGSCHLITELPGAAGRHGPPLSGWGRRSYIAGVAPNAQASLAAWIRSPSSLRPATSMPDLGVPAADARDMATYLLSLR